MSIPRNIENNNNANDATTETVELTEDKEKEIILFFKNCVVQREKNILQQMMKETVDFRQRLLKNPKTKLHETFSFYFVEPELVMTNTMAPLFYIKFIN